MKNNNLFTILLLLSVQAISQNLECKDFREGTFFMESDVQGTEIRIEMSREGTTQTEYYGIDEALHINLEWIDDCTYKMMLDEEKNEMDEIGKMINANGGILVTKRYIDRGCFYYKSIFSITKDEVATIEGRICREEI